MFHRLLCASVIAGLVVGIALTGLQAGMITPLLVAAEISEAEAGDPESRPHHHGEGAHTHAFGSSRHEHNGATIVLSGGAPDHDHNAAAPHHGTGWASTGGLERTAWTAVANITAAIGFALLLGAILVWRGNPTWRQGLIWGAAGFVVFFANPAIGLHPELPGTLTAEPVARGLWWLFAVGCSALGVGLLLLATNPLAKIGGAVLLVIPHLVAAPHPDVTGGLAPPSLVNQFIIATVIANGAFWLVLGFMTSITCRRFTQR